MECEGGESVIFKNVNLNFTDKVCLGLGSLCGMFSSRDVSRCSRILQFVSSRDSTSRWYDVLKTWALCLAKGLAFSSKAM